MGEKVHVGSYAQISKGKEEHEAMGIPGVKEFLDLVWETHLLKNQDYADGKDKLSNFRKAEALGIRMMDAILVRATDKWERVVNLHRKGTNAVKDEGFEDALLDLAGYAAIAYAAYMEEKENA